MKYRAVPHKSFNSEPCAINGHSRLSTACQSAPHPAPFTTLRQLPRRHRRRRPHRPRHTVRKSSPLAYLTLTNPLQPTCIWRMQYEGANHHELQRSAVLQPARRFILHFKLQNTKAVGFGVTLAYYVLSGRSLIVLSLHGQ